MMQHEKQDLQARAFDYFQAIAEETVEKAFKNKDIEAKPSREPSAFFVNPYDFVSSAGHWREKRSGGIDWTHLRVMAVKNPIIASIINTRINQAGSFTAPAHLSELVGNTGLGYKIVPREQGKKTSAAEEAYMAKLSDFIWFCGNSDLVDVYSRDNFDTWLRKSVRDSLTFDAVSTELVPTRRGGVAEFHAVDAATVRLAVPRNEMENGERAFVQVLNGQQVATFGPDEMFYGIRNPTTSVYSNGYGTSELEQLVAIVTNIFNAMTHNAMFFKNGAAVKGILNIKPSDKKSNIQQESLEAFKRAWKAMATGAGNAWTTPILQSDGLEFINMGGTNREMEFMKYLDFLVKLTCAVYAIDPAEINFYIQGGTGGSSAMFESNQEAKLKMSKDKGLRPLLSAFSRWINQFIMARLAPEFYFTFVGIDSKDEKEVIELRSKEVSSYKTVDEVRAEAGLDPMPEGQGGGIILNPQYTTYLQQQAMQAQMGDAGGGEDDDEDFSGYERDADEAPEKQEGEDVEKSLQQQSAVSPATKFLRISLI